MTSHTLYIRRKLNPIVLIEFLESWMNVDIDFLLKKRKESPILAEVESFSQGFGMMLTMTSNSIDLENFKIWDIAKNVSLFFVTDTLFKLDVTVDGKNEVLMNHEGEFHFVNTIQLEDGIDFL